MAKNIDADFVKPVLDNPYLKDAMGGSYDEFKNSAAKHGPDAEAKYDDLIKRLKDIFNKGIRGFRQACRKSRLTKGQRGQGVGVEKRAKMPRIRRQTGAAKSRRNARRKEKSG